MDSQPKAIPRILIVEDEPMVAIDIEQALTEFGFNIAGVAFSLETALELVANEGFDAAILDVNLKGMSAEPVADAISARGLPFIVTTGYGRDQRPEGLRDAPYLRKPYRPAELLRALEQILTP